MSKKQSFPSSWGKFPLYGKKYHVNESLHFPQVWTASAFLEVGPSWIITESEDSDTCILNARKWYGVCPEHSNTNYMWVWHTSPGSPSTGHSCKSPASRVCFLHSSAPHSASASQKEHTRTMILTGPPYGPVSTLWLHKQTIQPKHNTISSKMLLDLLLNTNERELNS